MSPYQLTHIIYVLLVIAFVAVMSYMFIYNIRAKNREKSLERDGITPASKGGAILEGMQTYQRQRRDRS